MTSFLNGEKPQSVLDALRDVAHSAPAEKISIDAFSKGLGHRSYGILLLTLTLPNLIPLPLPLLSVIFGLPLSLVGLQLALGFERPWIPSFLRRRGIKKKELLYFCDQVDKRYGWIHSLIQPRLSAMTRGASVRLIGLAICIFAATMALPIPLGNLVLALPIAILSLGLIERDGALVIGGLFLGCCGLAFNVFVGSSIILAMVIAIQHIFQ